MNCSIEGCPGEYEFRKIIHPVRHEGRVIVIDQVPAEVCTVCGDMLLDADTVRHIEKLLQSDQSPLQTVPLLEYS